MIVDDTAEIAQMTPTQIDRELGRLFRLILLGEASQKQIDHHRHLQDLRSSMLKRRPDARGVQLKPAPTGSLRVA